MSAPAALAKRLGKLKEKYRKGNYRRVLLDAQKIIERYPSCVPALIAYSRAAQLLQEDEIPGDPETVYRRSRQALLDAIALDSASVEALNELAYYVYAYEDSRRADKRFDAAIKLARAQLKEAYVGKLKCLADLGRAGEGKTVSAEASWLLKKQ